MDKSDIAPGKTRIGWIGTGVMGTSMCGHLISKGYEVTVFNRTAERAKLMLDKGARAAASPEQLAQNCDVIFAMVGFPRDVKEVFLGEAGALKGAAPGTVLVDMSTSEPSLAQEIYEAAKSLRVFSIDAPVSGGDIGAREARLSIMIGGDREIADRLKPLFECLGKTIVYQGPAGCGQHAKMVNQILIASGMIGICEGLLYGYKAGLNLETVLESVSGGAAGSWSLSNYAPRMLAGNFDPGFFVEHFIKDLGIALAEARRMSLSLPGLALAEQLYVALKAQGHGAKGTHSLILALSKLSGMGWSTADNKGLKA